MYFYYLRHIHDKNHRKRDMTKCFNQREVTRKRDRQTGLNSVKYKITDVKNMTIDDVPLTILNIHFSCDKKVTPWCTCDGANGSSTTKKSTKLTKQELKKQ